MGKRELEITVYPDGEVTIKVKGVAGAGCTDETKFIEAALGKVKSQELTADYYSATVKETIKAEGR